MGHSDESSAEETMETLHAWIDSLFTPWDRPDSPGGVLAVVRDGQIVCQRGYGLANLEHGIPNTPQTVFHIGSVSKQFTAMAVALLEQEGRLSLADDVRRHVPELPDYGHTITLDHLVHHTSGLRDFCELLIMAGILEEDAYTNEDILDLIFRQREPNCPPGEQFMYCNSGYALLALIVERVSGQRLGQFCDARIFQPLGMRDTLFLDSHKRVVRHRAESYSHAADGTFQRELSSHGTPGAGCLYTTVADLARWDRNLYDGQVGGPALITRMHEKGRLNSGKEVPYAFGLVHGEYRGLPVLYHYGSDAGYLAGSLRFPEQRLTVILLCNLRSIDVENLIEKIAALVLAESLKPATEEGQTEETVIALSPEQLERWAGVYLCGDPPLTWKIERKEDQLILGIGQGLEMETVAEDVIRAVKHPWIRMQLKEGEDNQLFLQDFEGYVYKAVEGAHPTIAELQEYAGSYYSPDLDIFYELCLRDDHLVLKQPRIGTRLLVPTLADGFYYDLSGVVGELFSVDLFFDRDQSGHVTGFRLCSGLTNNLRFHKSERPGA